jgi:hypothetical protein
MQMASEQLHAGKSKGKTTQQMQRKAKAIHISKIILSSFTHKETKCKEKQQQARIMVQNRNRRKN